MTYKRLMAAGIAVCSVCMFPASTPAQQDEARRELQVQLPASAQHEAVIHTTAAQGTQFSREILEEARISQEALASGRVSAVFDGNSVVVNRANLQDLAVPGRVLVEHTTGDAVNVTAPRFLMAEKPSAKTYKLSWRVITPQGDWDAWGRDSTGLIFDGPRTSFAGEFDVALVNPRNPSDRSRLDGPVVVAIAAPGASSIEPKPLEIANLGQWHAVEITVPNPDSESYEVRVSADPGRDGDAISMPVSRPTIRLSPTPRSITGWGIGKSMIEVQVVGVRDPGGLQVALESVNGTLSQGVVTLDGQGKGSVGLRSSRHAGTAVSVADGRFSSEPTRVVFESPWLYFALAVGGGLIAAFLKGRGQHHWLRALATGAVSGAVMALIYSVGINWLGTVFPDADIAKGGEAVVLVLGFAGAYLGVGAAMPKEG